jgi:hypothetical protein
MHVAVNPDANVYAVALLLTLVSGILFGAVPVRQVLHTDPYQVVKSGSLGTIGRRITVRDLMLGVQIAICAVLITSSFVAVRGLVRSLHSGFGFEPQNAFLVDTDLSLAGYRGDSVPEMQQRMIDALETIPGVQSIGLVDSAPLVAGGYNGSLFLPMRSWTSGPRMPLRTPSCSAYRPNISALRAPHCCREEH